LKLAVGTNDRINLVGSLSDALPGQTSLGKYDIFVIQYDAAGQALRIQQFGTEGDDFLLDAATDNTGNLYVAYQNDHIMLAKYEASGAPAWARPLGATTNNIAAVSLAVDEDTGLYALVSPDPYSAPKLAEVRKLDATGAEVWYRAFPASWPAEADHIAKDAAGGLYVAGGTDGALPGRTEDFGAGDVFLLKMLVRGNS